MSEIEKQNHSGADLSVSSNADSLERFTAEMKNLRTDMKKSVQGLANMTKISPRFIQAFENGTLQDLPGRVFARGFIRNICRAANKSPDDLLRLYDQLTTTENVPAPELVMGGHAVTAATVAAQPPRKPLVAPWKSEVFLTLRDLVLAKVNRRNVIVVSLGIASTLIAWNLFQAISSSTVSSVPATQDNSAITAQRQPAAVTDNTGAKQLPDVAQQQAAETPDAQVVQQQGIESTETQALTPAALATVSADVTEPVRVKVTLKGKAPTIVEWNIGKHNIDFDDEVELMIYDASAVRITYDGRDLGPLGKKGRIRRIAFSK